MKFSDFLKGSYDTALEPGQLVSVSIVPPARHLRGGYTKFTTGSSEERPCVGIAGLASMHEGVCIELRLVIGAVSPTPVRLQSGEAMARGERLTQELIERIAQDAGRNVEPIDDLRGTAEYKRYLVHVLTRRSLGALAEV